MGRLDIGISRVDTVRPLHPLHQLFPRAEKETSSVLRSNVLCSWCIAWVLWGSRIARGFTRHLRVFRWRMVFYVIKSAGRGLKSIIANYFQY